VTKLKISQKESNNNNNILCGEQASHGILDINDPNLYDSDSSTDEVYSEGYYSED